MPRWFLRGLVLFVVVFVAIAALVAANRGDDEADRNAPTPAPRQATSAADDLRALQRIATAHGGTRAAGTPGDRATAEYVADRLRTAGYRVTTQSFEVPFYRERKPPRVVVGGRALQEIRTLQFSPGGRATGRVRAVGLGCSAGDFAALRAGEIALAQRGDCFFFQKAMRARRAGAAAMLVVNDGPAPAPGSLIRPGPGIPVVGLSQSGGEGLAGRLTTVVVDAVSARRQTTNVIGETGPADAARVVMAGAHRDSVPEGPGMNDNGSGIVALLTIAGRVPSRRLPPGSGLRLTFWGGEEVGLLGSRHYVDRLPSDERRRIAAYLNLDMVASPGARPAVYDGAAIRGPARDGALRIEAALRRNLPPKAPQVRLSGDSDHASFEAHDIPAGGLFTGLDDCYHRACDRLANVDRAVLATSTRATERALLELAR